MGKINWESIFTDNQEFANYLSIYEFSELSLLTKFVRSKLKPILFQSVTITEKFSSFINYEQQLYDITTSRFVIYSRNFPFNKLFDLFNRQIEPFIPYAKTIVTDLVVSQYHLLSLSLLLPQITRLSISRILVSFPAFESILNSLDNLESLKVSNVRFFKYKSDTLSIESITLPSTLKYLEWKHCYGSLSNFRESSQLLTYNHVPALSITKDLLFKPDKFRKLKTVNSNGFPITFTEEFLLNNLQVDQLNFTIRRLNSIRILSLLQNISTLRIHVDFLDLKLNNINLYLPKLAYLSFSLCNIESWHLLEIIAISSPNLTELRIQLETEASPPLTKFINNITSFKKLTVKSRYSINVNFDNFLPHPNLKLMELWLSLDIDAVLLILSQCPRLKRIYFGKSVFSATYRFTLHFQRTRKPWKFTKNENFYKYYKN